ncbi:hypothetical protein ANO14919_140940 [Xylariales sp. No.14919]|nr:hypothetical protein ANO14919_140940 [Xylariales sp. No.14919]
MLHLGADGEDAVNFGSPSGSGLAFDTVANTPFKGDDAAGDAAKAHTIPRITPPKGQTSFHVFSTEHKHTIQSEQQDQSHDCFRTRPSNTTNPTNGNAQPVADDWCINNPLRNREEPASQSHNQFHRRAMDSSNRWGNNARGPIPRSNGNGQSLPYDGYYTNGSSSRAPFDFRCRAPSSPQYKYYPYQTAATSPFRDFSKTTPPECPYSPIHGPLDNYQYQGSVYPLPHLGSNQAPNQPVRGNGTNVSQLNQPNWDSDRIPPFNQQASTSNAHEHNSSMPLPELRKATLEQLQHSNNAAYHKYQYNSRSQNAFIYSDDGTNTETSSLFVYIPQPNNPSEGIPHGNPYYQRRSFSEPRTRRAPMWETSSPVVQGDQNPLYCGRQEDINSPYNETVRSPSPTCVNVSRPSSSLQPVTVPRDRGTTNEGNKDPAYAKEIQESGDEDYKVGNNSSDWSPISIKAESEDEVKIYDIPSTIEDQQEPNEVRYGDDKSDADTEDSYEPPRVPPNSPVSSPASLAGTHVYENTSQRDNRRAVTDNDNDRSSGRKKTQTLSPHANVFLPKDFLKTVDTSGAAPTSPKSPSNNVPAKAPEMPNPDTPKKTQPSAQKSEPNTVEPNLKSWSAVVSRRYMPSRSSDPFPVQPTTAPMPFDSLGSAPEWPISQPIISSGSPDAVPQALRQPPNNALNISSQGEVTPKARAGPLQNVLESSGPTQPQTSAEFEIDDPNIPPPPPNSPETPTSTLMGTVRSLEKLETPSGPRFPSGSSFGSGTVTPKSTSTGPIKVAESVCSTTSDSSVVVVTARTTPRKAPGNAASTRAPQPVPNTQSSSPVTPTPVRPAESTEAWETTPTTSASVPPKPQPRLWSQLLQRGGSARKVPAPTTKSDTSNIDDTNWPSLGSSGAKNRRKQNKSS